MLIEEKIEQLGYRLLPAGNNGSPFVPAKLVMDRKEIVKMTGFVNSTLDFSGQPKVIDGASRL